MAVLRTERDGLQERLDKANDENRNYVGQIYALQQQLAEARKMASGDHMAPQITASRLGEAEHEITRLHTINGIPGA